MSRSRKKAIVKRKWSGTQPEEKRHKRERMRVREAISHYGQDADMYLEPENFYEGERKFIIKDDVIRVAAAKAQVVKLVLNRMNRYVPMNSREFEFESKYGSSFWGSYNKDCQLNIWFPLAQSSDFKQAEVELSENIRSSNWVGNSLPSYQSWHDWMSDPERLYKSKYERK